VTSRGRIAGVGIAGLLLASTAAFYVACGRTPVDADAPDGATSGEASLADAADGARADAGGADGSVDGPAPQHLTVYPRVGAAADDTSKPEGPGLVLLGGTNVDSALTWAREQLGPPGPRVGDVVVLTAGGGNSYDASLYALAPFSSVQTLSLGPAADGADFDAAAVIVRRAEFVFYTGGDQSAYAAWKGTSLAAAVQSVWDRGGVVGGTSAGALILGAFVFDAISAGISENVTPQVALANPFDPLISFTRHMFAFTPLADAITEVHFEQRDRMGRLAMFMARQHTDGAIARTPKRVLGLAIDEGAAVLIDKRGIGTLRVDPAAGPKARAFVVVGGPPNATPGQRLGYPGLEVHRLDAPTQEFDFVRWCGTAPVYTLDVFPDAAAPFGGSSPYDRDASVAACP
jgi:cyanophycinase-like exopeptidase